MVKQVIMLLVVLIGLKSSQYVNAQSALFKSDVTKPEVGKPMPDFKLDNITHYKLKEASLEDFKGKWLFLDFWFPGCVTCIKSFPKVSAFHEEFKDQALFLLIGVNSQEFWGINNLYERLRKKQNLKMASAYDSVLVKRWSIHSMPHIIIVDPKGIVRHITGGRDMTSDKIRDMIAGRDVSFYPKDINQSEFDAEAFTDASNTRKEISDKLLYRSVLTKWDGEKQAATDIESYLKYVGPGIQVSMLTLATLYKLAYIGKDSWSMRKDSLFGRVYPNLVLEVSDSSLFEYDFQFEVGKGTYNYSLTVSKDKATPVHIMNIMQQELKNVFGFEVSIETRAMPVWKFITTDPMKLKKLRSEGGEFFFDGGGGIYSDGIAGFTARNFPFRSFLYLMTRHINDGQIPFINETGMDESSFNIDITIDALLSDRDQVRKALQQHGMDFVKGEKEMKVIVIRDPKPTVAKTN